MDISKAEEVLAAMADIVSEEFVKMSEECRKLESKLGGNDNGVHND